MVTFEETQFPVVVAVWMETSTREDADAYLAFLRRHLATAQEQQRRVAVVVDSAQSVGMPADVRAYLNGELEKFTANQVETLAGLFLVVTSPIVRGMLKAFMWISRGSSKKIMNLMHTYGTSEEAFAAARKSLVVSVARAPRADANVR